MNRNLNCRLCEKNNGFGKSHIIPESFCLHRKVEKEIPIIVSNKSSFYPKRRPIGEYDKNILCKPCEQVFGPWDNYGKSLLLDKFEDFTENIRNNSIIAYTYKSYDYEKLKLFFLSILWRASVSGQPLFKNVNLGPHENNLREIILNKKIPTYNDYYSVTIYRWFGLASGVPILSPKKFRDSNGIRYYRIYLGDYYSEIKVDKQLTSSSIRSITLNRGKPLIVVNVNIKSSNEYQIFKSIVNAAHNENAI